VPVVVRLYGSPAVAKGGRGIPLSARMLEGQSFHRANFCTAAASAIAGQSQAVHGPHRGGARVLHDFAEPIDLLGGAPRDPGRIVFAGSFTRHKGLDTMLEAWPRIAAQHGGARLYLFEQGTAGAARPHLDVRARLARLNDGARARVRTHPARESGALRDVFAHARVAVFPSRSGVFGMMPLEAMAAGCPVVHSRVANGLELIVNGRNGFLVDPEDPVQLAQACLLLLEDDALAARLGGAAQRTVLETFSRSALAAQHEAFYEEAIEEFHQIRRGGRREALHAAR
jgi:glycosyltransferase involved in cell wall biosynthesis